MGGQERGQERRQDREPERHRRVDPKPSRHLGRILGNASLQLLEAVKQAATLGEVGASSLGQAHTAGRALDQHRAEMLFQLPDLLAQARRGEA
jgi:hypothetical protein